MFASESELCVVCVFVCVCARMSFCVCVFKCVCVHTKEKQHTHLTRDGKLKQTEQVEDLRSKFEEQAREMENRYQVVEVVEVIVVDKPLPGEVQRPEG